MLRTIVAGVLMCTVTACVSWRPVESSPATYLGTHMPETVRVRLKDGSNLELGRPNVVGDTLRGVYGGSYRYIPMSDVAQLTAQEPDMTKTVIVATLGVLALVGSVYMAIASDRTSL
jgi:hypothetical protein